MSRIMSFAPKGRVVCERVGENRHSGRLEAMLVQPFTRTIRYTGSGEYQLFDDPSRGGTFTQETRRVVFLPVPEGTTVAQVNERLAQMPGACIYEVRANRPILSHAQAHMVGQGVLDEATVAARQIVSNPQTGAPAPDEYGNAVYATRRFSPKPEADVDMTAKYCLPQQGLTPMRAVSQQVARQPMQQPQVAPQVMPQQAQQDAPRQAKRQARA